MSKIEKPNIFLLPTPVKTFFYDVNRNEFVPISRKAGSTLAELLRSPSDMEMERVDCADAELEELRGQGYLSPRTIANIHHPLTDYIEEILDRHMSQVELQVTQNCNFRCEYCVYTAPIPGVQRTHQNKRMSWETAKAAIDYLWNHSCDAEGISVGFYGGEPLLEFELIKRVVEYSQKLFKGKLLQFSITTNASLLDDEKMSFCHEHDFHLIFSLDGPEEIQNRNRKLAGSSVGTYNMVSSKIKALVSRYPDYITSLGINMVVDPKDDLEKVFSIVQPGGEYDGIETLATLINDSSLQEKHTPTNKYRAELEYHVFLSLLKKLKLMSLSFCSPLADIIVDNAMHTLEKKMIPTIEVPESTSTGGMCIPGVNKLFVTADGDLYTCERVNEPSKAGYLGSLLNGVDPERAKRLLNVADITAEECKKCWAYRFCYSCVSHCDDGCDLSRPLRLRKCEQSKITIAYRMQIMLLSIQLPALLKNRKEGIL